MRRFAEKRREEGDRTMRIGLQCMAAAMLVAGTVFANGQPGWADRLTEADMTAKDFHDITDTETSVSGELRIEPPLEVHDLSEANQQAVKDAHGVKVIKGKEWKKLSPQERDVRMRELRRTMTPSTFFIIEVPSGNVWALDSEEFFRLKEAGSLHRWTYEEQEALPKAVKRDAATSQSDRHGTTVERAVAVENEEP